MKKTSGFTLIELMITVAIVAILAAIAIPSYSNYVTRANRSEAQSILMEASGAFERYYAQNYTYVGANVNTNNNSTIELDVFDVRNIPDGSNADTRNYILRVQGSTITDNYYQIRATARNSQLSNDSDCSPLTLDSTGAKGPDGCW